MEKQKQLKKSKVKCPICGSKFEIFGSFGLKKRTNAQCYQCGSLERHRLMFLYINNKIEFPVNHFKPLKILHFAPSRPLFNAFLNIDDIEYVPCDLFNEHYNKRLSTSKVIKVDITNIPFQDNYFDFILCSHVLEHIPNDKLAMLELYRVMKKGGSGIFQVPIDYDRETTFEDWSITDPKEREKAFGQFDHVRWYGRDYKIKLENLGFTVDENNYVNTFSNEEIFEYGLMKSELVYHCKK